MTYAPAGHRRMTLVLNKPDQARLEVIRDGSTMSQGVRRALRMASQLIDIEPGSKLILEKQDGTQERIWLI